MNGFVYFIAPSDCAQSWVKIGFTTGSVYARCQSLQTGCPFPLNVLTFACGTLDDELALHRRFSAYRGVGEWFALEGSLQGYIHNLMTLDTPMGPAPTVWTDYLAAEVAR